MVTTELAIEHLRMAVITARAVDAKQTIVMVDELAALLEEHDRLRAREAARAYLNEP